MVSDCGNWLLLNCRGDRLPADCFHSLLKALFWSGQIDRAR